MKGAYILELFLSKDTKIKIGKLGKLLFNKGHYYYCGSAQNNLDKRIERHKRKKKLIHWHIDYLTINKNFKVISAKKYETNQKEKECQLAKELLKKYLPINNFGSSDCKCISHLFFKSILKDSGFKKKI